MTEYIVKVLQRRQLSHSQSDIKHFIYLHSKWLENETELELFLTTTNTSYRATLKHDEIRSAAEDLEQPIEEFFAECKTALTTQMGLPGFDYDLDEQKAKFTLIKCSGYETLYVDVPLRKISNCHQLLDAAIECALSRPIGISESVVQLGAGASQPNELLAEYEQYLKDIKLEEKRMLKKFLMLINSKKERIEELERKLEKCQNSTTADPDSDVEVQRQPDGNRDDIEEDDIYGGATQAMTPGELVQD